MKRILLGFILVGFCAYIATAQKEDSLRLALKRATVDSVKAHLMSVLSFYLTGNEPDSAIKMAWQGIEYAKKTNSKYWQAGCYNAIGWAYYRLGKNDSGIYFEKLAINLYKSLNEVVSQARCMINASSIFLAENEFDSALNILLPARSIFEKNTEEVYAAYVDKEIGSLYRRQGLYSKAKEYLFPAIETFAREKDTAYLGDALGATGSTYWEERKYDSALYYYHLAYNITLNQNNFSTQAYSLENMGDAFLALCDDKDIQPWIDSALYCYTKAHDLFKRVNDTADMYYENDKIGTALNIKKDYTSASKYLNDAFRYFEATGNVVNSQLTSSELSKLYKDEGDYKKAFEYLDTANNLQDSLNRLNNASNIANMFAKYETDKKDRTILLLNTQQKLGADELSRQHIIVIFVVSVTFLGLFLAFIVWNRNRIKQRLKEVEMRNQISSDLHDDIGSSLSSILLLSNMVGQQANDAATQQTLLDKITTNTREVIEKMSDIVWTMNPKFDEGESLHERVENYILRLKEITNVAICGNIDEKIDEYHFTMELRKNIFLIIKEAMNNALKYANATLLQLEFVTDDKNFLITIKDNGKGFDKNSVTYGNGFESMQHRAMASHGSCSIKSEVGKGTLVTATIPIPHIR